MTEDTIFLVAQTAVTCFAELWSLLILSHAFKGLRRPNGVASERKWCCHVSERIPREPPRLETLTISIETKTSRNSYENEKGFTMLPIQNLLNTKWANNSCQANCLETVISMVLRLLPPSSFSVNSSSYLHNPPKKGGHEVQGNP